MLPSARIVGALIMHPHPFRYRMATVVRRATGLVSVCVLCACGGGADSDSASTPSLPIQPGAIDRIEPFDTSAQAKSLPQSPSTTTISSATAGHTVTLGALSVVWEKNFAAVVPGQPQRIGQARTLTDTASTTQTNALLQWHYTERGTQAAALRFVSEGALGVRLGVWVHALPEGAVLRFSSPNAPLTQQVSAAQLQAQALRLRAAGASEQHAQTFWSTDFSSAEVTLEVEIPADADPAHVALAVPQLAHVTIRPESESTLLQSSASVAQAKSSAGSCNLDITCSSEYLDQSRSVARLEYINYGVPFHCTGTLLNDASSSGTPYVVTAHHCVSTEWVASTVETDWFYRAKVCNTKAQNPLSQRVIGGAALLHTAIATDVSLLRLNEPPPAGVVYAGSYFGLPPSTGSALVSVHHPAADFQKLSHGTLDAYTYCPTNPLDIGDDSCRSTSTEEANFLRLTWQQGVVESGSSGAPAFVTLQGTRYVIGNLYGGFSSCENPQGRDYYGRFDVAYRNALSKWLNP